MVGSSLPDHCVYSYGLNLTGEDFYNKHSFLRSNDFVMSNLINDDVLSALEVYYGKVGDYDSLACRDLLLRKKIIGRESQGSLDKEALWDIITTAPPQEDAGRYYSS